MNLTLIVIDTALNYSQSSHGQRIFSFPEGAVPFHQTADVLDVTNGERFSNEGHFIIDKLSSRSRLRDSSDSRRHLAMRHQEGRRIEPVLSRNHAA